ncbi:MAG: hypothetical protein ABL970_12965 [Nitrospira sp.]
MQIVKQLPWWNILWTALALFAILTTWLLAHALTVGCGPSDRDIFLQRNYWP